ncbi:MAG: preprotein translocase subunit SecA [Robiginitomaculum sp.]|nr:preprotein translocase subunit SecA [Robiginitomaculum sp.]MDQ7076775.1 preprotein translocase subunit SecA [Robiginitomaculum sp.]
MLNIVRKIFGSSNERVVRRMLPRVEQINALESEYERLSDEAIGAKTKEFRERFEKGETLDQLLPEAFAAVREAAKRTLGQRHYDVQLMGGIVLHEGNIAEMRTGEGKTLVATLAVYLNAIPGKGVHVVTVNDYLASRDAKWMGQIYSFLGLTTGCIVHGLTDPERKENYACDVTYGTNNEFGFDYLRDNMKYSLEDMCQRGHYYAIVDEVDSILIDEARTPLIISGPTEDRTEFYQTIDSLMPLLDDGDFELDEKQRSIALTEEGNEKIEKVLIEKGLIEGDLYDIGNVSVVHHVNQALRAHKLYTNDKDYIVKDGKVMLIDEFTGRMMEGRRLSEGLHQAIEAKEQVEIQPENVTLASITFQNYFRLYEKLAGMTGTAMTEAAEFENIYKLDVIDIPTNKPVQRIDDDDELYRTAKEKYAAIVKDVKESTARNQPILVGTASIEKSEVLSEIFKKEKIKHKVLNARYHEQEAQIVAQAGAPGAVTIATNMAGRGTDIQLGGNAEMLLNDWIEAERAKGKEPDEKQIEKKRTQIEEQIAAAREVVLKAGGLYVLATERHESRRIDNQLRGRTGRQGDPGRSKFYVSVEDDLMRIFAPERMDGIMRTLGLQEGEAIAHPWMNKALETSQKKVEARNFEIRKNVLKYDDVVNDQRKAIFEQRRDFMTSEDVSDVINDMRAEAIEDLINEYIPEKALADQWDVQGLKEKLQELLSMDLPVDEWTKEEGTANEEIQERIIALADKTYAQIAANLTSERLRHIEKQVLLQVVDQHWREHLQNIDHLRSVVHLRSYAQRDPLNEFKTEAFSLFENLLTELRETVTKITMSYQNLRLEPEDLQLQVPENTVESHSDLDAEGGGLGVRLEPTRGRQAAAVLDPKDPATWGRVSRNAACPCGSGRKYKHCHGKVAS